MIDDIMQRHLLAVRCREGESDARFLHTATTGDTDLHARRYQGVILERLLRLDHETGWIPKVRQYHVGGSE